MGGGEAEVVDNVGTALKDLVDSGGGRDLRGVEFLEDLVGVEGVGVVGVALRECRRFLSPVDGVSGLDTDSSLKSLM